MLGCLQELYEQLNKQSQADQSTDGIQVWMTNTDPEKTKLESERDVKIQQNSDLRAVSIVHVCVGVAHL